MPLKRKSNLLRIQAKKLLKLMIPIKKRLSIENLEQEDMSENESELTNTPDEVVACTRNIGVQGDGTWQRRGHRSYNDYVHPPAVPKAILDEIEDIWLSVFRGLISIETQSDN
ncbi:hypothetical protein TSAR_002120 [Trichomalopsis sarcophagae]|uniref:Uncharacterized protein n=1 Tax=Trichomalopsis sarcophagae TaxID=543379 RepID=A0A232EE83_9HYME|nr:hypothetical protein TSAR_002120 [Trichomalopsis sarcophagae]